MVFAGLCNICAAEKGGHMRVGLQKDISIFPKAL